MKGGKQMDLKRIGNAMRLLRLNKEWSLDEESSMLDIHRNTLAGYEDNPENMSLGLLDKFLKIHNLTRSYFFEFVYDNSLNNVESE